jgi:hypothetical protein
LRLSLLLLRETLLARSIVTYILRWLSNWGRCHFPDLRLAACKLSVQRDAPPEYPVIHSARKSPGLRSLECGIDPPKTIFSAKPSCRSQKAPALLADAGLSPQTGARRARGCRKEPTGVTISVRPWCNAVYYGVVIVMYGIHPYGEPQGNLLRTPHLRIIQHRNIAISP